jgi:integrase
MKQVKIMPTKAITKRATRNIEFRKKNLSKSTQETYTNAVMQYHAYLKKKGLEEGLSSLRKWFNDTKNPNTQNLRIQSLKEFLLERFKNEAPEKRIELHEFFDTIKRKKPETGIKESQYMTIEEIRKLTDSMNERYSLITWALFWTGCRINELLKVELEDCSANGGKSIKIKIMGKGRKARTVYLPENNYHEIRIVFSKSKKYLFETRTNTTYAANNVSLYIRKKAQEILGREGIHAHSLRHSKAMFLKTVKGLSPDQVAKALGHSSVITTLQHYFHGTPSAEDQGIK